MAKSETKSIEPHFATPTILEICDLKRRTFARLVASGRFPRPDLKIGNRYRWKKSTIEQFLSEASKRIAS